MNNMKRKFYEVAKIHLFATLIFIFIDFVIFMYIPDITNNEMFYLNLFGAIIIFGLSAASYYLIILALSFLRKELSFFLGIIVILLNTELMFWILTSESLLIRIIVNIRSGDTHIVIFYPIAIIISYCLNELNNHIHERKSLPTT